jgi:Tol biopolymer transport system component
MRKRLLIPLLAPATTLLAFLVVSNAVMMGIRVPQLGMLSPLPPGVSVDYSPLRHGVARLRPAFLDRVLGKKTFPEQTSRPTSPRGHARTVPVSLSRIIDIHQSNNDAVENARAIPRPPFTAETNTSHATRGAEDPTDCGSVGGTVWYRFRSPTADGFIADTFGTTQSTTLGVYEGKPGAWRNIGCSTDVRGNAVIPFSAGANRDYYFQIASPTGGGPLVFNLDFQGRTTLESVSPDGRPGDNASAGAAISGNGRIIVFGSLAKNIVPGLAKDLCITHEPYAGGTTNVVSKTQNWRETCFQLFARDRVTGKTVLVTASPDGHAGNAHTGRNGQNEDDRTLYGGASLSWNGRYVAFASEATNLVPGDTNGVGDAFVRDLWTGRTERVSVDSQGRQIARTAPLGDVNWVSISDNGRFVAFESKASDVLPLGEDNNFDEDVFVRDRLLRTTTRVSVSSTGEEHPPVFDNTSVDNQGFINAFPMTPCLSGNGRYVAFRAQSSNMVPGDTNGLADIFVHDLVTRTTERVSLGNDGQEPNGYSSTWPGCLSDDGRYVVFTSRSRNLVEGDTNNLPDVFVRDRLLHTTRRVSVASDGRQSESGEISMRARVAVISANGRYVAFHSIASDLVDGDRNTFSDIFVHDLIAGTTTRVSSKPGGGEFTDSDAYNPSISGDGRFITFDAAPAGVFARTIQSVAPAQVYLYERSWSEP